MIQHHAPPGYLLGNGRNSWDLLTTHYLHGTGWKRDTKRQAWTFNGIGWLGMIPFEDSSGEPAHEVLVQLGGGLPGVEAYSYRYTEVVWTPVVLQGGPPTKLRMIAHPVTWLDTLPLWFTGAQALIGVERTVLPRLGFKFAEAWGSHSISMDLAYRDGVNIERVRLRDTDLRNYWTLTRQRTRTGYPITCEASRGSRHDTNKRLTLWECAYTTLDMFMYLARTVLETNDSVRAKLGNDKDHLSHEAVFAQKSAFLSGYMEDLADRQGFERGETYGTLAVQQAG